MWSVLPKIQFFLSNVLIAVKDAAFEYDNRLKLTSSPAKRVIFWILTVMAVLTVLSLILWILRDIFSKFQSVTSFTTN